MLRKNFPERRRARRAAAEQRNAAWQAMSREAKLVALAGRSGQCHKQRHKLT